MKIEYMAIKARRQELDLTQRELSEKTGVNLSVIKAVETGRSADAAFIRSLCEALSLDFDSVYRADFRDTVAVCVLNNKGGCGKTSVCGGLGYVLGEMGYRVLLVDGDAQRNLTSSFGLTKQEKHFGRAVDTGESLLDGYIQKTQYKNVDFVVADASMGTLDMQLFSKMHRENVVRQTLMPLRDAGIYDFVLIDTNPNLSLLNFNIVNAVNAVIIPVQMASFDVEGISTVIEFIDGIGRFNPLLRKLGIIINRYDVRTRSITQAAEEELTRIYGSLLFNTRIRVDVKIQNAQWENRPVFTLGNSRIAGEYRTLTREVLSRINAMYT